jgi:hypothetical protein
MQARPAVKQPGLLGVAEVLETGSVRRREALRLGLLVDSRSLSPARAN